jgi:hypothetical protein
LLFCLIGIVNPRFVTRINLRRYGLFLGFAKRKVFFSRELRGFFARIVTRVKGWAAAFCDPWKKEGKGEYEFVEDRLLFICSVSPFGLLLLVGSYRHRLSDGYCWQRLVENIFLSSTWGLLANLPRIRGLSVMLGRLATCPT